MPRPVSPITSIVLDLTRFVLALTVAVAHWTQPQFQVGWPDLTRIAVAAVGGFFVLSGFTIRLLTPGEKEFLTKDFFVERLSRLWSVVLPALIVTMVFDAASYLANHQYYMTTWGGQISHPGWRLTLNALFLNEVWGNDTSPFSNSLFWSLGYEAGFYFLYALVRSTRGVRRWALAAGAAVALGPNIVIMLVPWIGGVLLWDLCQHFKPEDRRSAGRIIVRCLAGLGLVGVMGAVLALRGGVPLIMRGLDLMLNGLFSPQGLVALSLGLRLHAAHIDKAVILGGIAFRVVASLALPLVQAADLLFDPPRYVLKMARRIGDATFPLYLFHFPLLVFLGALGFYDRHSSPQKAILFVVVCGSVFMASPLTASLKWKLRRWLGEAVAGPSATSMSVAQYGGAENERRD